MSCQCLFQTFFGGFCMISFADRLKELRKNKNVTQVEVARQCNMTERNYQRLESGSKPNSDNLIALADYFDVSTDYLLGRKNYSIDAVGNIKVKTPPDILTE